jgi:hypothetical protein
MQTSRIAISLALLTLSVSALTAGADAQPAPACQPSWQLVPTPIAPRPGVEVGSLTTLSGKDAWVAGMSGRAPFTLHWNGTSFTSAPAVPNPPMVDGHLDATAFGSDTAGMALLDDPFTSPLTSSARWDGTRWTITPTAVSPDPQTTGLRPVDVASVASDDAWAVGRYYAAAQGVIAGVVSTGTLIEHWDGTRWAIVDNPLAGRQGASLHAVTAVSADDIWAVGQQADANGTTVPLTEHWDGTHWNVVPAPAGAQPAAFYAVGASGPDDAWAVGAQTMAGTTNTAVPLVEHWNGTAWSVVSGLPDLGNARVDKVYAAGPDDVWAIVEQLAGANTFLHWDGTTWTTLTMPGPQELGLRYFYSAIDGAGPRDILAAGTVTSMFTAVTTVQVARLTCR